MGIYEISALILAVLILLGIKRMSSPKTAVGGNLLGAFSMLCAVLLVLIYNGIVDVKLLWLGILIGGVLGYILAKRVAMIQMPQMVGFLNGLGGAASTLVAIIVIAESYTQMGMFSRVTSQLAIAVGGMTFSGSMVAVGKLDRRLPSQPIIIYGHNLLNYLCLAAMVFLVIAGSVVQERAALFLALAAAVISLAFGILFAIRVGGADMPITISLLNSFSGLAGSICGLALGDPLLVAVGAIVGASGLILTGIMCRAMNRSLLEVLNGSVGAAVVLDDDSGGTLSCEQTSSKKTVPEVLTEAQKVIIVPGYGMAVGQAQWKVKELLDVMEAKGKEVKFAIHPVAGRMPGHMNVLLAEVDVPYDQLCEMDAINPEFPATDLVIVIGACDVVNPAAISKEGTPIYGMPILRVDQARHIIICNMDKNPGYSGVPNPLYEQPNVHFLLGNAADTLDELIGYLK